MAHHHLIVRALVAILRVSGWTILWINPDTMGYLGAARPERIRNLHGSTDMLLVVAVVAVYVLAAAPLAVLITFPASRYIDTAAVLLPALPLFGAIRLGIAFAAGSPKRGGPL